MDSASALQNLSFSNLQWKVANVNQALLDRFAGFTGLTYDEWAALEDSEDKWLFYLLCYNGYFPNAASYADCKSNSESMFNALNCLAVRRTDIPDGVVIKDTASYPIPSSLWVNNPENFGSGLVDLNSADIDATLFTRMPNGAKLDFTGGTIRGINSENVNEVLNHLGAAVDNGLIIESGTQLSVSQYAELQGAMNFTTNPYPPQPDGNYTVTPVSESDNISGIRNWTKLTGIPDSQYAKMDSIEKCSGKSFTSEQWQKILPNIKAKKGSYDDYGNEPSDIMIDGTYATWGEAGLTE